MTDIFTWVKIFVAGICGMFTYIFGGMDTVLQVLVILMVIDYITGVSAAICKKVLSSHTGFTGIMKKITILCVVACAHLLGNAMGIGEIRSAVIGFYIANESISIVENSADMGIPMPKKLIAILKKFKEQEDETDDL